MLKILKSTLFLFLFFQNHLSCEEAAKKLSAFEVQIFADAEKFANSNPLGITKVLNPEVKNTDVQEKRKRIIKYSREIYKNLQKEIGNRIPHITHRIWLTNTNAPHEVPADKLEKYFESLRKMKGGDWKHYFWCLDKNAIPETIKRIESSGLKIEIKELKEEINVMRGKHIICAYLKENRYTSANDIIRINIIYKYGGVYSDIGIKYNIDLTILLDCYDHILYLDDYYIDSSFIASIPNSKILNEYLWHADNLYKLSKRVKEIFSTVRSQMDWVAAPQITHDFDLKSSDDDRILLLSRGVILSFNQLRSWFGNGSLGNTPVEKSQLYILNIMPNEQCSF